MDLDEGAEPIVALDQEGLLRAGQVQADLRRGSLETRFGLREEDELRLRRTQRDGVEGQQVDVARGQTGQQPVGLARRVTDGGMEIVDPAKVVRHASPPDGLDDADSARCVANVITSGERRETAIRLRESTIAGLSRTGHARRRRGNGPRRRRTGR